MSGLIWIQSVWHSDGIHDFFFKKVDFEKISRRQKSMKNLPGGKEANSLTPFN